MMIVDLFIEVEIYSTSTLSTPPLLLIVGDFWLRDSFKFNLLHKGDTFTVTYNIYDYYNVKIIKHFYNSMVGERPKNHTI